jgi:hypothetical protein
MRNSALRATSAQAYCLGPEEFWIILMAAAGRDLHVHLPPVNAAGMLAGSEINAVRPRPKATFRRRVLGLRCHYRGCCRDCGYLAVLPHAAREESRRPAAISRATPLSRVSVQAVPDWSGPNAAYLLSHRGITGHVGH